MHFDSRVFLVGFCAEKSISSCGCLLCIAQILFISCFLIEQYARLNHLSTVVGVFLFGNFPFQVDVIPVKMVGRVAQMLFRPGIRLFCFFEVFGILRQPVQLDAEHSRRCIGTSMFRFLLLFTPKDATIYLVAPSTVDILIQCNGFFQRCGFVSQLVIIAVIQCNPDVIVIITSVLPVLGGV